MRRAPKLAVAALLAVLAGCGSGNQPTGDAGGGSPAATGGMPSGGDSGGGGGSTGSGGVQATGGTATGGGQGTAASGGSTAAGAGGRDAADAAPDVSDTRPEAGDGKVDTADAVRADDARDAPIVADGGRDTPAADTSLPLPSPSAVLEAMRRANDFFLARWPDPTVDIVTDKTRPSNLWTRAVYFEGAMALYAIETDASRKAAIYDYAVRWGASSAHPWALTYTAAATMTSNADNQACGQTYIDLFQIDAKPERIATIKANIDDMVARGTDDVWTWIDAIQMAMPVFAKLGAVYADPKYAGAMGALYDNARTQQGGGLRNPADGLWWRDLHFTPGGGTQQRMTSALHGAMPGSGTDAYIVAPNGKDLYWSRGNGWVMAALARVLDALPADDGHRATYVADLQSMAASLLPIQRGDGFWNESLLDPSHCAAIGLTGQDGPETSGTALFAYGLAWGVRQGLLDATHGAAAARAWQGLVTVALQSDGTLGYVQSTGDRPCTDSAALGPKKLANFDDYGVGVFLLAGSEIYRLAASQ